MKNRQILGFLSLAGALFFVASCGTNNNDVRIPQVTLKCSSDVCLNQDVWVMWATGTCSIADLAANKGVAQSVSAVGASDCSGTTCSVNLTSWTKPGAGSAGTISTVAAGTYTLCAVIDANGNFAGSTGLGDAGDRYTANGTSVSLNSNTSAQTIESSSYSVVP